MYSFKVNKNCHFKNISFIILVFISIVNCVAQDTDIEIFKSLYKSKLPASSGERMLFFAKQFLGKPYVGGSLEESGAERLVVKLNGFDCATLVESCMALSFTETADFELFKTNLQQIRYRNGKINGYGSRIHYLTDWLAQNQQQKYLNLETKKIGGKPYPMQVNFMSAHWNLYPRANSENIKNEILNSEKLLNTYKMYYLPKPLGIVQLKQINNGDIIAITTNKKGLDCSHQGIAVWQNDQLHILHASSEKKKVIISSENLNKYLNRVSSHSGIMLARLAQ
jgi:hypothetical protein